MNRMTRLDRELQEPVEGSRGFALAAKPGCPCRPAHSRLVPVGLTALPSPSRPPWPRSELGFFTPKPHCGVPARGGAKLPGVRGCSPRQDERRRDLFPRCRHSASRLASQSATIASLRLLKRPRRRTRPRRGAVGTDLRTPYGHFLTLGTA